MSARSGRSSGDGGRATRGPSGVFRGVVIEDGVDLLVLRDRSLDGVEEADELLAIRGSVLQTYFVQFRSCSMGWVGRGSTLALRLPDPEPC